MTQFRELPKSLTQPLGGPAVDLPAAGPAHPWERQPRETDAAWQLFLAYREIAYPHGPGAGFVPRDLATFCKAGGWDLRDMRRIAESHDWNNRTALYDRMIDAHKVEAAVATLPEVIEDHKRVLGNLRRLVACELEKWLQLCLTSPEPQVKIRELQKLLDVGVKLDRLTYGESTEILKIEGEWDLSGATLEELEALRGMAQKCAPGGALQPAAGETVH